MDDHHCRYPSYDYKGDIKANCKLAYSHVTLLPGLRGAVN